MNNLSKSGLILNAFESYSMIVAGSPLLTNPPEIRDDTVYVSWMDDEGNKNSIEFSFDALKEAKITEQSVLVKDGSGTEVQICFYDTKPVRLVEYQPLPIFNPSDLSNRSVGFDIEQPVVIARKFNASLPKDQQIDGLLYSDEFSEAFDSSSYSFVETGFFSGESGVHCLVNHENDGGFLLGPYPDGGFFFVQNLEESGFKYKPQ